MKSIFRKNDRVFDAIYGWGTVADIDGDEQVPIDVEFDNGYECFYTLDGRKDEISAPTLSFTEYEIPVNQVRPEPEIEIGQECYGRITKECEVWVKGIYTSKKGYLEPYHLLKTKSGSYFCHKIQLESPFPDDLEVSE